MAPTKFKYLLSPVLLSTLLFTACHHESQEFAKDTGFKITPQLLASLQKDTVMSASRGQQLTLSGTIAPEEDKLAKIYPLVSGIVQGVHAESGDAVHRGQVLATLKSIEMAGYTSDELAANASLQQARRALQSAEDMYKGGLSSQREVENARADYRRAAALITKSKTALSIGGGSASGYTVKSPISGVVITKNVTPNMTFRADNTQEMFTVADLSEVWVIADIYEKDVQSVKQGDAVSITVLAYPDKQFTGHIDRIYNTVDNDSKVLKARIRVANPGLLLKPAMFATINVQRQSNNTLPYINASALVFDNDKYYVVVIDGPGKAHIQPVTIARTVDDRAYISNGLKGGDVIVAARQLYMYDSMKDDQTL